MQYRYKENPPQRLEQCFPVEAVAKALNVHPATVRRRFLDEPDVIHLGSRGGRGRKQRIILRIPQSVLERVYPGLVIGHDRRPAA
jgi:hypothetical protein